MTEKLAWNERRECHGMCRVILAFVATLAVAGAVAAGALAALARPPESSLIVIGKSIGPIELGLSRADVVRRFGRPLAVERFEFVNGEAGRLARYKKHGGVFLITYVGGEVVSMTASATHYRTAGGVGPGAPLRSAADLPGFRFDQCTGGYSRFTRRWITEFSPYSGSLDSPIRSVTIALIGYFDC
jgi:hypothetical protein